MESTKKTNLVSVGGPAERAAILAANCRTAAESYGNDRWADLTEGDRVTAVCMVAAGREMGMRDGEGQSFLQIAEAAGEKASTQIRIALLAGYRAGMLAAIDAAIVKLQDDGE